ncbi:DUF1552 domain-containing protein [Mariniblastus fucicola]|uniref:DUF1552 domain-containing protein n=1 Tax=Mariniblastus fucicola TaxID=980251 RepID=A0A5B9PQ41_9BACT|nr:DUF1552 domain-containing protein [Mariniblastus fucicola]QEG24413.1 hypothetical protein MFFC18_43320 [Mariniblastus fucicola]
MHRINRRSFIRGTSGFALALPWFETYSLAGVSPKQPEAPKRLACFYMPDGVPMPLKEDPAFKDWSWFPHGSGKDFKFTKCLDPLEPLRDDLTVFSGLSHPFARDVHGHSNADQFLTGANTGGSGDYQNSISLDQAYAQHVGQHTRYSSLVLSTDGGTGSPRGAQTMSFNRNGRPIPAENRPKRIFDSLFVKNDKEAARRLALSKSALDDLMGDARSLRARLSNQDQKTLDDYLQSVRETELRVEKAKQWLEVPLPVVNVDHLNLEVNPEDPRNYLRTMFELIFLAFKTDSTRVVTYQLGRENGVGVSDYLARAIGFRQTHQLSHETKKPGGWENFGKYCRFLAEEYARFLTRLKATPEIDGSGSMLDNTLAFYGSASSSFHLSRNYPLILSGGSNLGFSHGQYRQFGTGDADHQENAGISTDKGWRSEMQHEEAPLSNLYLTMLQRLGVEAEEFGNSKATLDA